MQRKLAESKLSKKRTLLLFLLYSLHHGFELVVSPLFFYQKRHFSFFKQMYFENDANIEALDHLIESLAPLALRPADVILKALFASVEIVSF